MLTHAKNERGAALIVAIGFLLVLSLLVAVLSNTTLYEMLSSNNYQDSQVAFYAAETGVRQGMSWLGNLGAAPENSLNMPDWFSNTSTLQVPATSWSSSVNIGNASYRYYVQHLKDGPSANAGGESAKIGTGSAAGNKVHYYRITAEGSVSGHGITRQVQIVTTAEY